VDEYNRFGEPVSSSDETINGQSKVDVLNFIGNNNGRYYEIFHKNSGRKFFLSMNWAAFFLSVYWLFYRKMYLAGILFILISSILGSLISYTAISVFKGQILDISNSYTGYAAVYEDTTDDFEDLSEVALRIYELDMQLRVLETKIMFWGFLPLIILGIFFGLIADCLYRNHVFRKIEEQGAGGVSKGAVVGALALMILANTITEVINSAVIGSIIGG